MADLSVNYAGMRLKSPLICASGPRTDTVEGCKAAAEAGFGALVLKSLSAKHIGPVSYQHAVPRFKTIDRLHPWEKWHPDKGVENMDVAFLGEVGSVWGEEKYLWFINEVKKEVGDEVKVGASSYGSTKEEVWDAHFSIFSESKADFVEFALSNRLLEKVDVPKLIRKAKEKLNVPVTVKLPSFRTAPERDVKMLCDAGVDGVTMFDAYPVLDFDIETLSLPFRDTWCCFPGGFSVPYVCMCISACRLSGINTSISASFGPWEWTDVVKLIMSGADAVQSCRKVMVRGYKIAGEWLTNINDWLDNVQHCESISELKGRILDKLQMNFNLIPREEPLERGGVPSMVTEVVPKKCGGCADWCVPSCGYFAIEPKDYKVIIDTSKCAGCGICEGTCPFGALSLKSRK